MNTRVTFLAALCSLLLMSLGACTSTQIIRGEIAKSDPRRCNFKESRDFAEFANGRDRQCSRYSIEDHGDFSLAFVEIDDQGWIQDRAQLDLLMRELEAQTEGGTQDLSIYVYVHGWKHNADFCDSNVCCFRETLKLMQKLESLDAETYGWQRRKICRFS